MNPYFNHCIIFCSLGPEKDQLNRYNKPSDAQVKQINDTLSKLKSLMFANIDVARNISNKTDNYNFSYFRGLTKPSH